MVKKIKIERFAGTLLRRIILIAALLFVLVPFLYFVSVSFQSKNYIEGNKSFFYSFLHPTFENYIQVFSTLSYFRYFKNSLIICVISTVFSVIVASLASYVLSRIKNDFTDNLAFWILSQKMLPPIAILIPIYLILSKIRLLDTYTGIILIYTVVNLPYSVWMIKSFIDDVPVEEDESAMLDGCNKLQILTKIIYPIAKPGIIATGIFIFILSWSEFIFALILTSMHTKTLPVAISSFVTDTGIEWNCMAAAGTILVIPLIIMFVFIQKSLVRGLSFGAVKG
ncbi:MAG: carbohydrate ABC transporter permease [Spirochaetia bacterium]|jgi:multiple sugar transport system permease protein|nr:carbohydrate ABC transporter permease [Spirochaetia bacterium]